VAVDLARQVHQDLSACLRNIIHNKRVSLIWSQKSMTRRYARHSSCNSLNHEKELKIRNLLGIVEIDSARNDSLEFHDPGERMVMCVQGARAEL
jgi:hypothetical protein